MGGGSFDGGRWLNWQAGVTFTYKIFNLDLRYYDTNLSKENCFVLTGDTNARPAAALISLPTRLAWSRTGAVQRS